MGAARYIPNIITFIRFPLTLLLLFFIQRNEYSIAIAVFAVICLTDIFDGITARALAACTRLGAYMDVFADLLYVMASLVVLNIKGLAPPWFTAATAFKFIEFTVTSLIMKRNAGNKIAWIFDGLGRSFSVLAFIAPGVFCIAAIYADVSEYVVYFLLAPACALAIASSAGRVARCFIAMKSRGRPKICFPNDFGKYYTAWKNGSITATQCIKELNLKRTSFYKLVKQYEKF